MGQGIVTQHGCHHFPWGAIQLLQENIQLCIEFNKPDETASLSPRCNLASETCNIPLRPSAPLDIRDTSSTQLLGDSGTLTTLCSPLPKGLRLYGAVQAAMCQVLAGLIRGGLLTVSTPSTFSSTDGRESKNDPL